MVSLGAKKSLFLASCAAVATALPSAAAVSLRAQRDEQRPEEPASSAPDPDGGDHPIRSFICGDVVVFEDEADEREVYGIDDANDTARKEYEIENVYPLQEKVGIKPQGGGSWEVVPMNKVALAAVQGSGTGPVGSSYEQVVALGVEGRNWFESAPEEKERLLRAAVEEEPGNAHAHCKLAVLVEHHENDLVGAEALYRKVLHNMDPRHVNTLYNLAVLVHDKKDFEEAEALYRKALDVDPEHVDALGNLALLAHTHKEDFEEAEALYRKALTIDPKHVNTLCNLAVLVFDHKKKFGEAEALYREALDVDPEHVDTLYNLALLFHTHKKDFEEADALYRKVLEVDPEHVKTLYNLAILAKDHKKDFGEAEALYRKALEVAPEDVDAREGSTTSGEAAVAEAAAGEVETNTSHGPPRPTLSAPLADESDSPEFSASGSGGGCLSNVMRGSASTPAVAGAAVAEAAVAEAAVAEEAGVANRRALNRRARELSKRARATLQRAVDGEASLFTEAESRFRAFLDFTREHGLPESACGVYSLGLAQYRQGQGFREHPRNLEGLGLAKFREAATNFERALELGAGGGMDGSLERQTRARLAKARAAAAQAAAEEAEAS